jgi:hypothetical protein
MRSLLYRFEGVNVLFTGTVQAVTVSPDKEYKILLILDLRHKGVLLDDHVWIKVKRRFSPAYINKGTVVTFSGKVQRYTTKHNKQNFGITLVTLY